MNCIDIYTDASLIFKKKQFGIGIIIADYKSGNEIHFNEFIEFQTFINKTSNFNGSKNFKNDSFNAYVCELYGIVRSLTLIDKNYKGEVNIYCDGLVSLEYLNTELNRKVRGKSVKFLKDKFIELSEGLNINLFWIKGHNNTWGNEIADKFSRKHNMSVCNDKLEWIKN